MDESSAPRPFATVHYAQTLDGRIATRAGHSQWISCDATLRLAHRLRAEHDAVLVGVGTVLADNPRLTVRYVAGASPARVVLDSRLRIPLDAHVVTDRSAPTTVATTELAPKDGILALKRAGVHVLVVARDGGGHVDLRELFIRLMEQGVGSVLIEGGREVITSALSGCLADRLIVCIAPKVIGEGIDAVGDLGTMTMEQARTFEERSFTVVGDDVVFEGRLARR